jgi:hypothetical protein
MSPGEKSSVRLTVLKGITKNNRSHGWREKIFDETFELNAMIAERGLNTVGFKVCVLVNWCDVQTYQQVI